MNELLRSHLVDQRNRVAKGILDLRRIIRIDRGADIAKRAAKARAELTVVLAPFDVLTVRFQR